MSIRWRSRFLRYWPAVAVLVAGLAISGWMAMSLYQEAVQLDADRFELETLQIAAGLESNMERYEERLARLADHCAQFETLPAEVWYFRREVMTDLDGNLPSLLHAVYCPKVDATNFQSHLERGRKVWDARYRFDPEPRPGRGLALPVWQQWSRSGAVAISYGTDMAETSGWRPSLLPALTTGRGWVSAQPAHAPGKNGASTTGFWFALSLFPPAQTQIKPYGIQGETPEDQARRHRDFRKAAAKGVFAVFLSTDHMVDRAFNSTNRPVRVHARLYTAREPVKEAMLNPQSATPEHARHQRRMVMPWYGRRWCLELKSTPLFEAESLRYRAWIAAGGGSAFSLLAMALVGISLRARVRQERLTADITEARDALAATEKLREQLGHDLHDGAIQSLYAIQLGLTRTAETVASTLPAASQTLNDTRQRVDEVIAELRGFILSEGEPSEPHDSPNLEQVLASLVQRLQSTTTAELRFEAAGTSFRTVPVAQVVTLTQIARTALANCLRHAQASRIVLKLEQADGNIRLVIEDDGVGFDTGQPENGGLGLRTIRKRAAEAGGSLTMESRPGQGTCICVSLPCTGTDPSAGNLPNA